MAISSIDFSVNFLNDKTTSFLKVTDVTDYSLQGVTASNVRGLIRIVSDSGTIYDNVNFASPDLDLSSSRLSDNIGLPVYVGTNNIVKGDYHVTLTVTDDAGVTQFTRTKSYNFNLDRPTADLSINVDCVSPLLTSTDTTAYNLSGVTPINSAVIVAVSTVDNTVSFSGNVVGLFKVTQLVNISGSSNNDGAYTIDSIAYDKTTDRTIIEFVEALTDNTVNGIVYTKEHKIFFPSVLSLNPIVGFTNVLSTSTFYTGNQEFSVKGYYYYTLTNGFSATFYLEKTLSKEVTCDIKLCDIYCCISKTLNSYLQYKGNNDVLANNYKNAYILANSYLSSLQTQLKCGNSTNVDKILAEIQAVTGCTSDCSCEDGGNVLIQGLGSTNNVDVVSTSNQLKVVSTVAGNTTTFTLSLDADLVNALQNIVTVTLEDSATIEVNEVIDGSNNKTYTPAIKSGVVPDVVEQMSFLLEVQYRFSTAPYNARPSLNFTVTNVSNVAQLDFSTPTIEDRASISLLNYPESNNVISIKDFQVSSDAYKVLANVVKVVKYNSQDNTISSSEDMLDLQMLDLKIIKKAVNDILISFSDNIVSTPTQSYITENYQSVFINFLITK